ncbi:MAG: DUF1501 domain-containing protein [Cyclobacteriaceae bacterium]|nr:DUF1501 domain-containing protein [Cyclobacteriaceae bacterium]
MKRRQFLRNTLLTGTSITLGGFPLNVLASESRLSKLAEQSVNDRVLVILQLHGGNDGLNSVIPIDDYDLYYSRRANIAIPKTGTNRALIELDSTLASGARVGLHPDMGDMKKLYDYGRLGIVQGVSYTNNNGSHFRGRDIWFMGGGPNDYYSSGWVGRYLQHAYEPLSYPDDFPNNEMKDPLAIELGSDVSLIFHQQGNIPASISLGGNPESFANLVDSLEGFVDEGVDPRGKPPIALDNSPYGKEMNWILGLEDKTEDYADRLREVWDASSPSTVTYPETYPFNAPKSAKTNPLSGQLQLIARLLEGGGAGQGVKTKVFLLRIGGFDTHAEQVESYDPTMGVHATQMYHIATAMKAFQDDLKARGLEDRVLTMTTSEFGRRIASNGSYGTDHGTGGPMFLFGPYVKSGVLGNVPDLNKSNVDMQYDFKQIYYAILKDWFEVEESIIQNDILFRNYSDGPDDSGGSYEPLQLFDTNYITSVNNFIEDKFNMKSCYPNPAKDRVTFSYRVNAFTSVRLVLTDLQGKIRSTIVDEIKQPGEHQVTFPVNNLPAGQYIYRLIAGPINVSDKLTIVK